MARDLKSFISEHKNNLSRYTDTTDSIVDKYKDVDEDDELNSVIDMSNLHIIKDTKGAFEKFTKGYRKKEAVSELEDGRQVQRMESGSPGGVSIEEEVDVSIAVDAIDRTFQVYKDISVNMKCMFEGHEEPSDAETLTDSETSYETQSETSIASEDSSSHHSADDGDDRPKIAVRKPPRNLSNNASSSLVEDQNDMVSSTVRDGTPRKTSDQAQDTTPSTGNETYIVNGHHKQLTPVVRKKPRPYVPKKESSHERSQEAARSGVKKNPKGPDKNDTETMTGDHKDQIERKKNEVNNNYLDDVVNRKVMENYKDTVMAGTMSPMSDTGHVKKPNMKSPASTNVKSVSDVFNALKYGGSRSGAKTNVPVNEMRSPNIKTNSYKPHNKPHSNVQAQSKHIPYDEHDGNECFTPNHAQTKDIITICDEQEMALADDIEDTVAEKAASESTKPAPQIRLCVKRLDPQFDKQSGGEDRNCGNSGSTRNSRDQVMRLRHVHLPNGDSSPSHRSTSVLKYIKPNNLHFCDPETLKPNSHFTTSLTHLQNEERLASIKSKSHNSMPYITKKDSGISTIRPSDKPRCPSPATTPAKKLTVQNLARFEQIGHTVRASKLCIDVSMGSNASSCSTKDDAVDKVQNWLCHLEGARNACSTDSSKTALDDKRDGSLRSLKLNRQKLSRSRPPRKVPNTVVKEVINRYYPPSCENINLKTSKEHEHYGKDEKKKTAVDLNRIRQTDILKFGESAYYKELSTTASSPARVVMPAVTSKRDISKQGDQQPYQTLVNQQTVSSQDGQLQHIENREMGYSGQNIKLKTPEIEIMNSPRSPSYRTKQNIGNETNIQLKNGEDDGRKRLNIRRSNTQLDKAKPLSVRDIAKGIIHSKENLTVQERMRFGGINKRGLEDESLEHASELGPESDDGSGSFKSGCDSHNPRKSRRLSPNDELATSEHSQQQVHRPAQTPLLPTVILDEQNKTTRSFNDTRPVSSPNVKNSQDQKAVAGGKMAASVLKEVHAGQNEKSNLSKQEKAFLSARHKDKGSCNSPERNISEKKSRSASKQYLLRAKLYEEYCHQNPRKPSDAPTKFVSSMNSGIVHGDINNDQRPLITQQDVLKYRVTNPSTPTRLFTTHEHLLRPSNTSVDTVQTCTRAAIVDLQCNAKESFNQNVNDIRQASSHDVPLSVPQSDLSISRYLNDRMEYIAAKTNSSKSNIFQQQSMKKTEFTSPTTERKTGINVKSAMFSPTSSFSKLQLSTPQTRKQTENEANCKGNKLSQNKNSWLNMRQSPYKNYYKECVQKQEMRKEFVQLSAPVPSRENAIPVVVSPAKQMDSPYTMTDSINSANIRVLEESLNNGLVAKKTSMKHWSNKGSMLRLAVGKLSALQSSPNGANTVEDVDQEHQPPEHSRHVGNDLQGHSEHMVVDGDISSAGACSQGFVNIDSLLPPSRSQNLASNSQPISRNNNSLNGDRDYSLPSIRPKIWETNSGQLYTNISRSAEAFKMPRLHEHHSHQRTQRGHGYHVQNGHTYNRQHGMVLDQESLLNTRDTPRSQFYSMVRPRPHTTVPSSHLHSSPIRNNTNPHLDISLSTIMDGDNTF